MRYLMLCLFLLVVVVIILFTDSWKWGLIPLFGAWICYVLGIYFYVRRTREEDRHVE